VKFWLSAALMCVAVMFAEARVAVGQESANAGGPRARKIDEFGDLRGCDHLARLDNFAIELTNDPSATGYVVAYGARGAGSGTAEFRLRITKDYFVNTRGLVEGRIRTLNGGRFKTRNESFIELWLVPLGAEPPRPAVYKNDADEFKGKFSEFEAWDSFDWGEETGPPVGNANLAGLADVLKSQPEARAYIVAFNGEQSAPGAWRRVADREAEGLKRQGINADRVRIIFGGYDEELKLQLWALPKDAPPPARDAGPERKPARAAQIGAMNHYQLSHADEARSFFRGFAEVLKADESLTAYVFVRLPSPRDGDGEVTEPADPPPADMQRVAEGWRDALKKEYGLSERRLVVQVVPATEEWASGEVEAWVVPAGAAPPDPYAKPAEDAGGESAEEAGKNPEEF
jgi:hypothetical protein